MKNIENIFIWREIYVFQTKIMWTDMLTANKTTCEHTLG